MSPLALADDFGVDPLRYHLLRDVPLGGDGDFSYEGIVARYNADLANNLGNLVSRVTTVVHSKCGGIGPGLQPDQRARPPWRPACSGAATAAWARWAPHEALEETWRLIGAANAELEAAEPWKMEPGPEVDAVLGRRPRGAADRGHPDRTGHAVDRGRGVAPDRGRRRPLGGPAAAMPPAGAATEAGRPW